VLGRLADLCLQGGGESKGGTVGGHRGLANQAEAIGEKGKRQEGEEKAFSELWGESAEQ